MATFTIGQHVRYKPGYGSVFTFDEKVLEADGRLPGIVIGHTPTKVRVELTLVKRNGTKLRRTVAAFSLQAAP